LCFQGFSGIAALCSAALSWPRSGESRHAEPAYTDGQHEGTEDDYALFAQLAGDLSVGEWVREVLLKAVLSERTAEAHRTILSEVLALRKIVLNLQFSVAAGQPVTRDRMLTGIEEADAEKGERAPPRLTAGSVG
jgi:hypothetical protein